MAVAGDVRKMAVTRELKGRPFTVKHKVVAGSASNWAALNAALTFALPMEADAAALTKAASEDLGGRLTSASSTGEERGARQRTAQGALKASLATAYHTEEVGDACTQHALRVPRGEQCSARHTEGANGALFLNARRERRGALLSVRVTVEVNAVHSRAGARRACTVEPRSVLPMAVGRGVQWPIVRRALGGVMTAVFVMVVAGGVDLWGVIRVLREVLISVRHTGEAGSPPHASWDQVLALTSLLLISWLRGRLGFVLRTVPRSKTNEFMAGQRWVL